MKPEKRIARIIELMDRLEAGGEVTRSSLSRVLTPEQMASFVASWDTEKRSRNFEKPKEIVKYEKLLRDGVLAYGKYEATHQKLTSYKSGKLIEKAQSTLDKAVQYAQEIVVADSSLRLWFDRDPADSDFGHPAGAPRIITSKSYDNESRGEKLPFINSIRDLKLAALSSALDELQGNDLTALAEEKPLWLTSTERPRNRDFTGWKF